MPTKSGVHIVLALTLLAAGLAVAGCADQHQHVGDWGNQWYRPHHTPADDAKHRHDHPDRPSTDNGDDDDSPAAGGGYGPGT